MDDQRFDQLVRLLAGRFTRRRVVAGSALALPGVVLAAGASDARGRKKKCQPKCAICQTCKNGRCKAKPNGTACGGGKVCTGGGCGCPAGLTVCNGACVNLNTNVNHCGSCATACGQGLPCEGGTCQATIGTCTAGEDSCTASSTISCNQTPGNENCHCQVNTSGDTVCVHIAAIVPCGCTSDADCRGQVFPDGHTHLDAVCIQTANTPNCNGFCPDNLCVLPCPG